MSRYLFVAIFLGVLFVSPTSFAKVEKPGDIVLVEKSPFLGVSMKYWTNPRFDAEKNTVGKLAVMFFNVIEDPNSNDAFTVAVFWEQLEIIVDENANGMLLSYVRPVRSTTPKKVTLIVPREDDKDVWVNKAATKIANYTAAFLDERRKVKKRIANAKARKKETDKRLRRIQEGRPLLVYPK